MARVIVAMLTPDEDVNIDDSISIMIAEDNEVDRRMLEAHCERFGWRITSVASGGELLAEIALANENGQAPDCLLIDWHMPHLDGLTTINRILEMRPEAEPPAIVLVTAMDATLVAMAADDLGAYPVLHKPVDSGLLFDVVSTACGNRGQTSGLSGESGQPSRVTQNEASEWPDLPGLDQAAMRTNVGDDAEFFQELCDIFTDSAEEAMAQLAALKDTEEREALRNAVHKLRGQMGTLGALEYQALAGRVEQALVDELTYQDDLDALIVFVRQLVSGLRAWRLATQKPS
jgi:CheY-like chemotaxis protein